MANKNRNKKSRITNRQAKFAQKKSIIKAKLRYQKLKPTLTNRKNLSNLPQEKIEICESSD